MVKFGICLRCEQSDTNQLEDLIGCCLLLETHLTTMSWERRMLVVSIHKNI